mgnify:CR=1 FL=1
MINQTRRRLLHYGLFSAGAGIIGIISSACTRLAFDPAILAEPDNNGLRLLPGFTSRVIARSGEAPTPRSDYRWHAAPDGGATFVTQDNGWRYVSNSEINHGGGGVGAIVFDKNGQIIDAYSILQNTSRNCAGGATPWDTWLSCEEIKHGRVWEGDPFGKPTAMGSHALGICNTEAVAVDPIRQHIYLTEDKRDSRLYRYSTTSQTSSVWSRDNRPALTDGKLEVAQVLNTGKVTWHEIPDPGGKSIATRHQVPQSTAFKGGEGIVYHNSLIYFSTKHDNRIWRYDTTSQMISILYDDDFFNPAILRGVDDVIVSPNGRILVAEDGDDQQIVSITQEGQVMPVVQMMGHQNSEVTGLAFSPAGDRFYFSSQRGTSGRSRDGITFEISGPTFL